MNGSEMTTAVVATAFGGPEVLSVIETPVGVPGLGEVLLQVRAAGTNPVDYKMYGSGSGQDPAQLPMRLGREAAGVVTAVGKRAEGPAGRVEWGDEVIGFPIVGACAAEVVVPASSVIPKPTRLSFEQASGLMLTGTTAVHALTVVRVGAGDTRPHPRRVGRRRADGRAARLGDRCACDRHSERERERERPRPPARARSRRRDLSLYLFEIRGDRQARNSNASTASASAYKVATTLPAMPRPTATAHSIWKWSAIDSTSPPRSAPIQSSTSCRLAPACSWFIVPSLAANRNGREEREYEAARDREEVAA